MKRFFALLLATILLLSTMSFASADGNKTAGWSKYVLDDISVQISIPQNYYVLTRGMDADDPLHKVLSTNPSEVDIVLIQKSAYLFAYTFSADSAIMVSAVEQKKESIRDFSEDQLEFFKQLWSWYLTAEGTYIEESKIISINGLTFVRHLSVEGKQGNPRFHYIYQTIQNSKLYTLDVYAPTEQQLKQNEEGFVSTIRITNPDANESQTHLVSDNNNGWNKYVLDDLSMQISIPEHFIAIRRGMDPQDAILKQFGLTPSEIDEILVSGLQFLAIDSTDDSSISLVISQFETDSIKEADTEELELFLGTFYDFWEQCELDIKEAQMIVVNGFPFARYLCSETYNGHLEYQLIYVTVQDNALYTINCIALTEQMLLENEAAFLAGLKIFEQP